MIGYIMHEAFCYKIKVFRTSNWFAPVIPATWEVEDSELEANLGNLAKLTLKIQE